MLCYRCIIKKIISACRRLFVRTVEGDSRNVEEDGGIVTTEQAILTATSTRRRHLQRSSGSLDVIRNHDDFDGDLENAIRNSTSRSIRRNRYHEDVPADMLPRIENITDDSDDPHLDETDSMIDDIEEILAEIRSSVLYNSPLENLSYEARSEYVSNVLIVKVGETLRHVRHE